MTKKVIAAIAAIALSVLDYILVVEVALYATAGIELLLPAIIVGVNTAIWLRKRWLVFFWQNTITVLLIFQLVAYRHESELGDALQAVVWATIGNLLAWLVARSIPTRSMAG